jgi:transcriptional regulator with XRE-family HTH domain
MLQFLYQMETFPDWLEWQIKQRGWKPADLARAADLPNATISRILNETRQAGPDACKKIARALNVSQEEVFRRRGFLDPLPPGVLDHHMTPEERELIGLHRRLPPDRREAAFHMICGLVQGMTGRYTFVPASDDPAAMTPARFREIIELDNNDLFHEAIMKLLENPDTELQRDFLEALRRRWQRRTELEAQATGAEVVGGRTS